jgi:hypothetical protein
MVNPSVAYRWGTVKRRRGNKGAGLRAALKGGGVRGGAAEKQKR